MQTETNVDENLPQKAVGKRLAIFVLDGCVEITLFAILHQNADGLLSDERILVPHDEDRVDLSHNGDLLHSIKGCSFVQLTHIYLLYDVVLILQNGSDLVRLFYKRVHIDS